MILYISCCLFIISLILYLCYISFKTSSLFLLSNKEHFSSSSIRKRSTVREIYDEFYTNLYTKIIDEYMTFMYEFVYQDIKNNAELMLYDTTAHIGDFGCGTGNFLIQVKNEFRCTGIDLSIPMLQRAQKKTIDYPNIRYLEGDMTDHKLLGSKVYTHIVMLYFSFYYVSDIKEFLKVCTRCLKDNGYLIIQLVDKHKFDPVLVASNPFPLLSAQNYSEKRVTSSSIYFNNMEYKSDFQVSDDQPSIFTESIYLDTTKHQYINEHLLYMADYHDTVQLIMNRGFELTHVTHLSEININYNYLFYFQKKGDKA